MVETGPALECSQQQGTQASSSELDDSLSQLPEDIQLAILSYFTMKEAAKTCVLSKKWNHWWRCFPVLNFENSRAVQRMWANFESYPQECSNFVKWVNDVMGKHLGPAVDELRIAFGLDNRYQTDIDKWVAFALARAKRLELDFNPCWGGSFDDEIIYNWLPERQTNLDSSDIKSPLTSVCLKSVNITAEQVEGLLLSCPLIEDLCIINSPSLTHFSFAGSSLHLKHLKLSQCEHLKFIDISAPQLLSFGYNGFSTKVHIRDASMLSKISVGTIKNQADVKTCFFDCLSNYFSQLVYLNLDISLSDENTVKFNSGISDFFVLANLQRLRISAGADGDQSLLGLVPLIQASPVLHKLTIKVVYGLVRTLDRPLGKAVGRPLESLRTLEIEGYLGTHFELELAYYVISNSIMLKEVVVGLLMHMLPQKGVVFRKGFYALENVQAALNSLEELEKNMPPGAKLRRVSLRP